jgi:ribosomal protein S18 acetylase RimI-like enzyme
MNQSFHIRQATLDDVPALAALHVKTYRQTHGFWGAPSFKTRYLQWQAVFYGKGEHWFCLVLEDKKGDLIGFVKGQPYSHQEHNEFSGELNKIYLLKRYQGIGLGRALLCEAARQFVQRGIYSTLLFGDAKNRSNGFYEKMGAEKLFAENGDFHGGYGWRNLRKLIDDCSG